MRETQTKLGHAELARNEAVALAADRLLQIEALLAQARTVPPRPALDAAPPVKRVKSTVPRPPRATVKTPKPVKWWIKRTPSAE